MNATAALEIAWPPEARAHRTVAARDLLHRLPPIAPRRVGNLRGGPEAMEDLLARRFPDAEIVPIAFALDAGGDASSLARYRFPPSCIGGARPDEPLDLIFSNGALEMLPSLRALAPELLSLTKPGGLLAFQLPDNLHEPNRELLRMVAVDGPWARTLIPVAKSRPFNATIEDLDLLLRPLCESVEFWRTTYVHRMGGVAEIIDIMRETSLAAFLRPLDDDMRRRFLERYADELARAYPVQPDGALLWRFPRIFFLARR